MKSGVMGGRFWLFGGVAQALSLIAGWGMRTVGCVMIGSSLSAAGIPNDDYFSGSGVFTVTSTGGGGGTPYSIWSGGRSFTGDFNGDGVDNGMGWILGAANASANSLGLLPTPGRTTGLTLHFKRVHDMGPAHLYLHYSSDLGEADPWHSVLIPAVSGTVGGDIGVVVVPGSPTDDVTVTIPSAHAAGGSLFGRLTATEN
jgi:hypothetical protein